MKNNIRLLLIQNKAILGDREANFKRINELLEPFGDKKFDLIVFPELWNVVGSAVWSFDCFPRWRGLAARIVCYSLGRQSVVSYQCIRI